jgi:hypothetical protein
MTVDGTAHLHPAGHTPPAYDPDIHPGGSPASFYNTGLSGIGKTGKNNKNHLHPA